MEVVRKIVDARKLMSIIPLQVTIRNRRLEVIVLPAEVKTSEHQKNNNIEDIVDSLVGIIPDTGRSLEDYRAERLEKYESLD